MLTLFSATSSSSPRRASVTVDDRYYNKDGVNPLNDTCYEVYFATEQGSTPVDWDSRMDDGGITTVSWDVNIYTKQLACNWEDHPSNDENTIPDKVDTMNLCVNLVVWQANHTDEVLPHEDGDLNLVRAPRQQGSYNLGLSASGTHVKQHIHNNEAYHNQGGVCVLFQDLNATVAAASKVSENNSNVANQTPTALTRVKFTATVRGEWTALSLEPWQGVQETIHYIDTDQWKDDENHRDLNETVFRSMTRLSNGESDGRTFHAQTVSCWEDYAADTTRLFCDYEMTKLPTQSSRSGVLSTYYTLPAAGYADTRPESDGCQPATLAVLDAMTAFQRATIRLQPIGACCIPLVLDAIFNPLMSQLAVGFKPNLQTSIKEYYKTIKVYADNYAYCDVIDAGVLNIKDALYLLSLVAQSELPTSFAAELNNYGEESGEESEFVITTLSSQ